MLTDLQLTDVWRFHDEETGDYTFCFRRLGTLTEEVESRIDLALVDPKAHRKIY